MSAMDAAYANAVHIPDGAGYPDWWAKSAAAFRAEVGGDLDCAYGPGPREVFDVFDPPGEAKGTVVFVHGGYWLEMDKSSWSHLAWGPLAHGYRVVFPSYPLCPSVRISDITRAVARAVDHIAAVYPGPLVLTGHSAGGHLVARMGCADVALACRDRVVGIVPISPLSDLRPLMLTSMDLRLDEAEALAESPALHPAPAIPVHIFVGGAERPAFLDQARWLAEAWQARMTVPKVLHHFNIIGGMGRPESELIAALVNFR